ncbi:MAG: ABC transporter substrate-binding protein [Coriobacteriales bacterium]
MKKFTRIAAVAACAALAACLGLAGCGGSGAAGSASGGTGSSASFDTSAYTLVEDGKLTIGSDLDYPPMESLVDGQPYGFDVAMMQEIANRLGLELNYLDPQNFDSLITQVNAGNTMDVAVSSITITDDRAELVDFSDSYYDSNQAIVIMKGAFADKKELNDPSITVAAQSGTSGEAWVAENLPKAKYIPFTATTDAVTALVAGQCQAVVYDQPIAETHVATQFTDCEVLEVIATGEQYGIAVNKSNSQLLADINACLKAMEEDGTMESLRQEYLG